MLVLAFNAVAPAAVTRDEPRAVQLPFLKISNLSILPALPAPASMTIWTDLLSELTRVALHVSELAGLVDCVEPTELIKLKHAESVKEDEPAELNALMEKQYERFEVRPSKSNVGTFPPVLYGQAAMLVPAGTGRSLR